MNKTTVIETWRSAIVQAENSDDRIILDVTINLQTGKIDMTQPGEEGIFINKDDLNRAELRIRAASKGIQWLKKQLQP